MIRGELADAKGVPAHAPMLAYRHTDTAFSEDQLQPFQTTLPNWILLLSALAWSAGIIFLSRLRFVSSSDPAKVAATLRFSPLGLAGLCVLLVTGISSADLVLINSEQLSSTPWGYGLIASLALASGLLFVSVLYAWHLGRQLKTSPQAVATRTVRRWILFEGVAAVAVVAVTAVIALGGPSMVVSTALPPLEESTEVRDEGITLAGDADPLFVLLHSVPNRAGMNRLGVTVVDWQVPERLYETTVRLRLENERGDIIEAALRPDGDLIEMPSGNMGRKYVITEDALLDAGHWLVEVEVHRPGEPNLHAQFDLPVAEDPGLILQKADEALSQVKSVRMVESLSGAGVPIVSEYAFMTPDRMHMKMDSGFERIVIGHSMYERMPDEAWRERRWPSPSPFAFPMYAYVDIASDTKLLAIEEIDGRAHYRVQFVHEPSGTYYEVWADVESYRTRQLTMMAPAHYMYWEYFDYEGPDIEVVPPES